MWIAQICEPETNRQLFTDFLTATPRWDGQSDDLITYPLWPNSSERRNHSNEAPHYCIWRRDLHPRVNVDLVAGWLNACYETHKHRSNLHMGERVLENLRFIDMNHGCVVKSHHHMRYAGLSYTWGSREQYRLTKQNVRILEEIGGLSNLAVNLHPIVTDAMQVCNNLDIPYLWMDSLCIVQHGEVSKQSQIRNMEPVYANVYITLIAASEEAPGPRIDDQEARKISLSGLAGVLIQATKSRVDFFLRAMSFSCSTEDVQTLHSLFTQSLWSTRGW
jgi:hypothetical protein